MESTGLGMPSLIQRLYVMMWQVWSKLLTIEAQDCIHVPSDAMDVLLQGMGQA